MYVEVLLNLTLQFLLMLIVLQLQCNVDGTVHIAKHYSHIEVHLLIFLLGLHKEIKF